MTRAEMRARALKAMVAGGMSGGEAVAIIDELESPLSTSPSAIKMRAFRERQRAKGNAVTTWTKVNGHTVTKKRGSHSDLPSKNNDLAQGHTVTCKKIPALKKEEEEERGKILGEAPTATPPVRRQEQGIPLNSKGEPRLGYDPQGNFTDPFGRFRWTNDYIRGLEERFPGYKVRGQIPIFATKLYGSSPKENVERQIVYRLDKSWQEAQAKIKSVKREREAEVAAAEVKENYGRKPKSQSMIEYEAREERRLQAEERAERLRAERQRQRNQHVNGP